MKDGLHQSYNKTEMADLEFLGSFAPCKWIMGHLPKNSQMIDGPNSTNMLDANEHTCSSVQQQTAAASELVIMTVSWSINTLAVAKLVPLRPGIRRCDEQDERLGVD